jgi:hypothetical protein
MNAETLPGHHRFQRIAGFGAEPVRDIAGALGLASLVVAGFEYHQNMRTLGLEYGASSRPLTVVVAALIGLLGLCALTTIILRL